MSVRGCLSVSSVTLLTSLRIPVLGSTVTSLSASDLAPGRLYTRLLLRPRSRSLAKMASGNTVSSDPASAEDGSTASYLGREELIRLVQSPGW